MAWQSFNRSISNSSSQKLKINCKTWLGRQNRFRIRRPTGLHSSSSSIGKDHLAGRRSQIKLRTWMTSNSITNWKDRVIKEGAFDRGSIFSIRGSSRRLSSLNNTTRLAATLRGRLRGTKTHLRIKVLICQRTTISLSSTRIKTARIPSKSALYRHLE